MFTSSVYVYLIQSHCPPVVSHTYSVCTWRSQCPPVGQPHILCMCTVVIMSSSWSATPSLSVHGCHNALQLVSHTYPVCSQRSQCPPVGQPHLPCVLTEVTMPSSWSATPTLCAHRGHNALQLSATPTLCAHGGHNALQLVSHTYPVCARMSECPPVGQPHLPCACTDVTMPFSWSATPTLCAHGGHNALQLVSHTYPVCARMSECPPVGQPHLPCVCTDVTMPSSWSASTLICATS